MLNIIIRTGDAAVGDMLRSRRGGAKNFAGPPYTWLGRSGGSLMSLALRIIGAGFRTSAGTSSECLNLSTVNYNQSNTHGNRISQKSTLQSVRRGVESWERAAEMGS